MGLPTVSGSSHSLCNLPSARLSGVPVILPQSTMPLRSEDSTSIAAASPSTPACFDDEDIENNIKIIDDEKADPLANYIMPVLPKDTKTAFSAPPSPWTRFRIWYNPYRQVRPHQYQCSLSRSLNPTPFFDHSCVH